MRAGLVQRAKDWPYRGRVHLLWSDEVWDVAVALKCGGGVPAAGRGIGFVAVAESARRPLGKFVAKLGC